MPSSLGDLPASALALMTDFYQLAMAQGYFLSGRHRQRARFDYFFRTTPFQGGHVIFAGLGPLLESLAALRFDAEAGEALAELGFERAFIDHLRGWRFGANVRAVREGEVVFANEPLLQVEGDLLETQLIETLLLNTLNFASLVATKASRIALACQGRPFVEFGLRRAQGLGALQASRAAIVGGAASTSNVLAARQLGLEPRGTLAHAWIQQFDSELEAFRAWGELHDQGCVVLIDTYNTLHSGLPNAIILAEELAAAGKRLEAVRLDSGDLAYLSKKVRAELDRRGLHEVRIYATNQLDEHLIKSLLDQGAPIDLFGVGTRLVTGHPDGALDGVYKLAERGGEPSLKISDNFTKVNLPGHKDLYRVFDEQGSFYGDAIALHDEAKPVDLIHHPYFPAQRSQIKSKRQEVLLDEVMRGGEIVEGALSTASQSAAYARERLKLLPAEHLRFDNPHTYKVGLSPKLLALRTQLYDALQQRFSS